MIKSNIKNYEVFFVDDDFEMHKFISDELEKIDCNVNCFSDGIDCLEQLSKQNCNLVISAVKIPGMDGLALLNKVRQEAPWLPVMLISSFGNISMAVKAIQAGAVDFVEKPLIMDSFLHKVKSILTQNDNSAANQSITNSEKKVLKLILDGKGNKEIAFMLSRAVRTVERHRSSIKQKFGVDNLVDLVKKTSIMNCEDVD